MQPTHTSNAGIRIAQRQYSPASDTSNASVQSALPSRDATVIQSLGLGITDPAQTPSQELNDFNTCLNRLLLNVDAPYAIDGEPGNPTFKVSAQPGAKRHVELRDVRMLANMVGKTRPGVAVEFLASVLASGFWQMPHEELAIVQLLYTHLCRESHGVARGESQARASCSQAVATLLCSESTWVSTKLMLASLHAGTTDSLETTLCELEQRARRPDPHAGFSIGEQVVVFVRACAAGEPELMRRALKLLPPHSSWAAMCERESSIALQRQLPPAFVDTLAPLLPARPAAEVFLRNAFLLLRDIHAAGVTSSGVSFCLSGTQPTSGDLPAKIRALANAHGAPRLAAELAAAVLADAPPQFERNGLIYGCAAWLSSSKSYLSKETCARLSPVLSQPKFDAFYATRILAEDPRTPLAQAPPRDPIESFGRAEQSALAAGKPFSAQVARELRELWLSRQDETYVEDFEDVQEDVPATDTTTTTTSTTVTAITTVTTPTPTLTPTLTPTPTPTPTPTLAPAPDPEAEAKAAQDQRRSHARSAIERLLGPDAPRFLGEAGALVDELFVLTVGDTGKPVFEASEIGGGCVFRLLQTSGEAALPDKIQELATVHGAALLAAELAAAMLASNLRDPAVTAQRCASYLDQAVSVLAQQTRDALSSKLGAAPLDAVMRRLFATHTAVSGLLTLGFPAEHINAALRDPKLVPSLDRLLKGMPFKVSLDGDIDFPPEDTQGSVRAAVYTDLPEALVRLGEPLIAVQLLAGVAGAKPGRAPLTTGQINEIVARCTKVLADHAGTQGHAPSGTAPPLAAAGLLRAAAKCLTGARKLLEAALASGWATGEDQHALQDALEQLPPEPQESTEPVGAGLPGTEPLVSMTQVADQASSAPTLTSTTIATAETAAMPTVATTITTTTATETTVTTTTTTPTTAAATVTPTATSTVATTSVKALPPRALAAPAMAAGKAIFKMKRDQPALFERLFGRSNATQKPLMGYAMDGDVAMATPEAFVTSHVEAWFELLSQIGSGGNDEMTAVVAAALLGAPDCPQGLRTAMAGVCVRALRKLKLSLPLSMQKALQPTLSAMPNNTRAMAELCPSLDAPVMQPISLPPVQSVIPVAAVVARFKQDFPELHEPIFGSANKFGKPLATVGTDIVTASAHGLVAEHAWQWVQHLFTVQLFGNHEVGALLAAALTQAPATAGISRIQMFTSCAGSLSGCSGSLPTAMQLAVSQAMQLAWPIDQNPSVRFDKTIWVCPIELNVDAPTRSMINTTLAPGVDEATLTAIAPDVHNLFLFKPGKTGKTAYEAKRVDGHVVLTVGKQTIAKPGKNDSSICRPAMHDFLVIFDRFARKGAPALAASMVAATVANANCTSQEVLQFLEAGVDFLRMAGAALPPPMKAALAPLGNKLAGRHKALLEQMLQYPQDPAATSTKN